jgi:hypothetical protein
MRRLILILVLSTVAALAWLPPMFTHGACTAEFDALGEMLQRARPDLLTLARAQQYLNAHGVLFQVMTAERCESAPPPDVLSCPEGGLVLGAVPVRNRICRFYRDGNVRFQLGFNHFSQLMRIQTDMNPYQMLKLPLGLELDLAK